MAEPDEHMTRKMGRNAAILGLLIFLLYASLRWVIYRLNPVEDFADWVLRDTLMDAPRLLVFALSLRVGLRFWNKEGLGLHARGVWSAGMVFVVFFVLLWLPDALFRTTPMDLGISIFVLLAVSSVLVGLWEEILYRGVLFNALRDWQGPKAAVWGSSLLFTIMHVQAQPLSGWPSIFLCGMVFALLRLRGVGLIWLIACHALYDTLIFFGGTGPSQIAGLPALLFLLRVLFVYALYRKTKSLGEERPAMEPSPVDQEAPEPELVESPREPVPSEAYLRLRGAYGAAVQALEGAESYRIRLHIFRIDASGSERDLGPWPDAVAQASRLEDATDLCSMLSYYLRGTLFRNARL